MISIYIFQERKTRLKIKTHSGIFSPRKPSLGFVSLSILCFSVSLILNIDSKLSSYTKLQVPEKHKAVSPFLCSLISINIKQTFYFYLPCISFLVKLLDSQSMQFLPTVTQGTPSTWSDSFSSFEFQVRT